MQNIVTWGQNMSANMEEFACISMGGLFSGVPPSANFMSSTGHGNKMDLDHSPGSLHSNSTFRQSEGTWSRSISLPGNGWRARLFFSFFSEEVGRAEFNVPTPIYASVA